MIVTRNSLKRKNKINENFKLISSLKKQIEEILERTIKDYGNYFMTLGEMREFVKILKLCGIKYKYTKIFNIVFSINDVEYIIAKM